MRWTATGGLVLGAVLLLGSGNLALGGFFDQLVDQAKQTLEQTLPGALKAPERQQNNSPPRTLPPSPPTTTKKPAYNRAQLFEIQQRLNDLGYNAGKPDGLYGPGTRKAIEAFQLDHGLVIDGQPSAALLAALTGAAAKASTAANSTARAGAQVASRSAGSKQQGGRSSRRQPAQAMTGGDFSQPTCSALEQWSSGLQPNQSFAALPGISLNERFADRFTLPLFGVDVLHWRNEDTTALQRWLNDCRGAAAKRKDKPMIKQLAEMRKEVVRAYKQLRILWSTETMAEREVDRLLNQHDKGPAYLSQLQQAIQVLEKPTATTASAGAARRSKGSENRLAAAAPLLLPEKRQQLLSRLRAAEETAGAALAESNQRQQELLQQIAQVPVSKQGLGELMAIASRVDAGSMSQQQYSEYNQALQSRRQYIQQQLAEQRQQQQQRRMTEPAPVVAHLGRVLRGDEVEELSFAGLRVERPYAETARALTSDWGLKEGANLSLDEHLFTATRRQLNRSIEQQAYDGGTVTARTRKGTVGQLVYEEHYLGPMPAQQLKAYLIERFGKPDRVGVDSDSAIELTWEDGDRFLRVRAANRVRQWRQMDNFRSSVSVNLWSEDFADYLADARETCRELEQKSPNRMSARERMAVMSGCLTP